MSDAGADGFMEFVEQRIGKTLCDRYTIESVLGVGGMAAVYRGRHRNGNPVAIKILHVELSVVKDIRDRFLREGYVANRVEHPGAVRVLDDDKAEDGAVFLVMELLEGETLEDFIERRGGTLTVDEIKPLISQLLEVIGVAHTKGIVHRDIKPENLFIQSRDNTLKILDFGIARLVDPSKVATKTGRVMGTPVYMAPEQARGLTKLVDAQTDLWAIGATFYRALTGHFVHEAETQEMTLIAAATQPARGVRELAPHVSDRFASVIDKALQSDKSLRWADASEMLAAMQETGTEPTAARQPQSRSAALAIAVQATIPADQPTPGLTTTNGLGNAAVPKRITRRDRALVAIAGVVLAGAGAIGVTALVRRSGSPATTNALVSSATSSAPVIVTAAADSIAMPLVTASASASAAPSASVVAAPATPISTVTTAFDENAAHQALTAISLQSCATPDGPTGAGHATVTFGPAGNVVSVVLDDQRFTGTAVGACISGKLARARTAAFAGGPRTVEKGFGIRAAVAPTTSDCKGEARFDPVSGKVRPECIGR